MNAPLAAPGLLAGRPRISVIGAGPGGLAIAMVLAAQGARVTVHEKATTVGGRTRSLRTPEGFTFDLGPTFFLYPRILQEIFEACGGRLEDEVELKRIDPLYRLVFEGAASIDATADETRMAAEIAKIVLAGESDTGDGPVWAVRLPPGVAKHPSMAKLGPQLTPLKAPLYPDGAMGGGEDIADLYAQGVPTIALRPDISPTSWLK